MYNINKKKPYKLALAAVLPFVVTILLIFPILLGSMYKQLYGQAALYAQELMYGLALEVQIEIERSECIGKALDKKKILELLTQMKGYGVEYASVMDEAGGIIVASLEPTRRPDYDALEKLKLDDEFIAIDGGSGLAMRTYDVYMKVGGNKNMVVRGIYSFESMMKSFYRSLATVLLVIFVSAIISFSIAVVMIKNLTIGEKKNL